MNSEPTATALLGGAPEPVVEEVEVQEPPPSAGETVTISKEQFQELMNLAGVNASAAPVPGSMTEFAKIIAAAMIEAKKPYVDPRQVENEKSMRDSMRNQAENLKRRIADYQMNECTHIMGSHPLSDAADQFGRTAIAWHRVDTGTIVGVCTVCQRVFTPADADYRTWRSKKSASRMSSAGQRQFLNYGG